MPAMVSAITVPPKTGADIFPSIFQDHTNKRKFKSERIHAKYFKATSDHFRRSKFDTLPRRCFDLPMFLGLHQNSSDLTAPSVGKILIAQGVFITKKSRLIRYLRQEKSYLH